MKKENKKKYKNRQRHKKVTTKRRNSMKGTPKYNDLNKNIKKKIREDRKLQRYQ